MAPPDPLTELRERVQAAQEAAERLAGEARHETRDELEALVGLLRTLRELVPAELQQQLTETIRQLLLLVRALIDFWVERLEAPRPEAVEVEDIPVE
jgi:signal transduction histidine kinase